MNNWLKGKDESNSEYISRICSHKEEIGTWEDVASIINEALGLDRSESYYRKNWKREVEWNEQWNNQPTFLSPNFSTDDCKMEALEQAKTSLEMERVRVRDERARFRAAIRQEARYGGLKELIASSISKYDGNDIPVIDIARSEDEADSSLIVHLTDIHAGIVIDNSVNKYDGKIMEDRLNQYFDKIYSVAVRHRSSDCYLVLGGDLINGAIHLNSRLENHENVVDQVIISSRKISQFIVKLLTVFKNVNVYNVPGNHSRVFPNKESNQYGEYLDRLVFYILMEKFSNINSIRFYENTIHDSVASFSLYGNLIYAVHGDKDSPSSVVQRLTMMTNNKPDMIIMGHRHSNSMSTVYDTKIIESGCLSGPDSYCMDNRLRNKPEQTIIVMNKKEGYECSYDVRMK